MRLDQFQVWELLSGRTTLKAVQVIPILNLIEAIILAVPSCLDHGLVGPSMSLKWDQGVECSVDADQGFANYAVVRECIDGVPHVLRAGPIVIVCKRGGARKLLVIVWVKFAHIHALGDLP